MREETLEEFLARGGEIQQCPPEEYENKGITVHSTSKTPNIPMHISEGALFFAERFKRKKKERKFTGDISLLPPKLVAFLKARGKL